MRIFFFNKKDQLVKVENNLVEAHLIEQINTASQLTFTINQILPSEIQKACIPSPNGDGFLMFKILTEQINGSEIEYTCIESAYDELATYGYIKDLRPSSLSAEYILQELLKGTRWELGKIYYTSNVSTNFYYEPILNCIQDVVEIFGLELTFTVAITGNQITARRVNMFREQGRRTGKRFEYGSNALEVAQETSTDELYTALVGRGKGEQVDGDNNPDTPDGYGRRITFADIEWKKSAGKPLDKPKGQEYLEDPDATKLYGFSDGKPRIGIVTFEDDDDKNVLLTHTYQKLQELKRPQVQFKAAVIDVGDLGLGDTVAIIRHDFHIEYMTRVFKVDHDLLDKSNNMVELGDDLSGNDLTSKVNDVSNSINQTNQQISYVMTATDGQHKVAYSPNQPTTTKNGDLWYKDLGNGETELYIYNDGWQLVTSTEHQKEIDDAVDQAMQEMADKEKEINGKLESNQIDISQAQADIEQARQDAANSIADIRDSVVKDVADAKAQSKDALDKANTVDDKATEALTNAEQAVNDAKEAQSTTAIIKTDVDTVKGQLSSKADKITVDDLTKTVSNNSTSITQNAKDIKTKANSSTVNTLAGKMTDAETSISQNATDIKSKADKSTVDTLNQTVKSQGTSITQNANAIKSKASSSDVDKLSGRVSTAETALTQTANGLKGKADKTELDKTNNSLTTLSNNFSTTSAGFQSSLTKITNTVDTNKTNTDKLISDTNKQLSVAKADIKATADNLSTNYTKTTDEHDYVNSQIKQSADKLEASVASVSDVANAEDTNLIFNGSFKNGDNWRLGSLNPYFGVGSGVPISAGTYMNFSSPTDANTALTLIQNPNADVLRSITGNTVTMSIYARCQKNGGQIKVYIRTEDADGNYSYFNSDKAYDLTTAWTRYSMTAKLPTEIKAINLSFQFINIAANVVCYATGAMLNMGNVLLPYSESTLDSDAKIAKLEIDADGIKQTVSNKADTSYVDQKANSLTTTIGRNKTDADNKISRVEQTANTVSSTVASNKKDADTQFSNINQTIKGITSTVAGKADISQVSQLSNQINLVVKNNNTEHTNLLLNGSFRNGDNWRGNSNVADTWYSVSGGVPIVSGHYGGLYGVGNANPTMMQSATNNVILAVKGQKVTLSAYARCEKNGGQFRPYIRTTASDGSYSYFGTGSTWYDLKTGWQRYSVTGTLPSDITAMTLNLQYTNVSDGLKCYFTGAMLTLGDQLFPYQDSTNDIVSQINIDESGVLIQGKKIMIDGDATIKNAVIKSSMIDTLDASKITAGTLNAANVNIINMNANNITTGTLKGTNLSMNLNTGEVLFQKGSIKSTNGKLNISVDDGTMAVTDELGYGALFADGKLYMTSVDNFNNIISGTSKPTVYGAIEATRFGWFNESAGMVMHGSGSMFGITQDNSNTSITKVSVFSDEITDGRGLYLANKKVYLGGDAQTQTIITSGIKFHKNNSFLHPDRQPFITVGGSIKFPDESANDIDVPSNGSDILIVGNRIGLNSARINYKSDTWYSGYTDWYMRDYHGDFATVRGKNFVNSSQLSKKTDIKQLDVDKVRNAIRNVDIREYRYKSDVKNGEDKVYASAIIDDVNDPPQYNIPYDWITSDGTGRDDGTATGYLIVTTQDLYNQIDELKAEIKQLKGE